MNDIIGAALFGAGLILFAIDLEYAAAAANQRPRVAILAVRLGFALAAGLAIGHALWRR